MLAEGKHKEALRQMHSAAEHEDSTDKHNVTPDIEMIPIQQINQAYERLLKSDVKYRFVIDMASLK